MNQATHRLFFALWPDAKLQRALHRIAQDMHKALGGRAVITQNIHLTLAFLGSVPEPRIATVRTIADAISVSRFQLDLAETGCWKRNGVAWIAPDMLPASLQNLVLELREGLFRNGFEVDDKPFLPHITLLRKSRCRCEVSDRQRPLAWPVDQFVLMRSDTLQSGPVYSQIGAWSLR